MYAKAGEELQKVGLIEIFYVRQSKNSFLSGRGGTNLTYPGKPQSQAGTKPTSSS